MYLFPKEKIYFCKNSAEIEENNYYPFGLKQESNILNFSTYNYGYNGKELQTETGWNDYGARMYMPDIARWGVIDPLAETSRRFNPYNYALNNPMMFIDPDGRKAMAPNTWEWNTPTGGALGYMLGGGASTFGSFAEFLGEENPLTKFNNNDTGGGAGIGLGTEATYDEVMDFLGLPRQQYFQGIDFSQFGNDNDEEPVNFFGNNSHDQVFRDKFEQQFSKFKNTKGDGIFRVYGHGDTGMIWNDEQEIWNAKTFDKVMGAKNKNWKNIDKYENPILFLYSCLSGFEFEKTGKSSAIARKISKQHPNLTVVGFDSYVDYGQKNSGMSKINFSPNTGDGNGYIVIFKNGEIIHKELFKNYIK
ncbi:RHS repeat domain-containing protein [Chryseobacterium populi]|uniref:RHS repeat-associated core domain protein containing protein n=1 Tax=Chryseobacterium populi TaxID=1144316 RepID=J3CH10_9FLAO|nr:RHS repeat-associated core domain protein containing protein [Chryseobacterium populi]